MSTPAASVAPSERQRPLGEPVRAAFVGSSVWLDGCAPPEASPSLLCGRFTVDRPADGEGALDAASEFEPNVTVLFDPASLPPEALRRAPGTTLGVHVGSDVGARGCAELELLDRLIAFDPALTGSAIAGKEVWRAIPPPVSDANFADVRALHGPPRAISVGRSSAHRERMLMPAKHHHDLLQVIHGVTGETLRELFSECDVGVFVAAEPGGGFGAQVGMHLAAGHLLLSETLTPTHALERGIDYLHVDSPGSIVHKLDRMARFPEMHQRVRVRGRLKAEQYRASRVFARLAHDLLADVSAFDAPGMRA